MSLITFETVKNNDDIRTYITQADQTLNTLGFTEHSFAHVTKVAMKASEILTDLGYSSHEAELAKIAGFIHDIGNVVNRDDHAQSGAVMAFILLDKLGMPAADISQIVCAIGNHDEHTSSPSSPIAAALVLADKSDVRRTRVRNRDVATFDIHDRVNYAVTQADLFFNSDRTAIILKLTIDTEISAVIEYFEIFLGRMVLCRKAAQTLGIRFELLINGSQIL